MTCPCNSVPCVCPQDVIATPVPRGHCNRCDRCGWPFNPADPVACRQGDCSMRDRGKLPKQRSHCSGCGAPFAELVAAVGPLPTTGLASQALVAPHSAFCDSLQPGPDLGPSEKPCNCRPTGLASAESPTIATTAVDVSGPPVATNVLSPAPAAAPLRPEREGGACGHIGEHWVCVKATGHAGLHVYEKSADRAARPEVAEVEKGGDGAGCQACADGVDHESCEPYFEPTSAVPKASTGELVLREALAASVAEADDFRARWQRAKAEAERLRKQLSAVAADRRGEP